MAEATTSLFSLGERCARADGRAVGWADGMKKVFPYHRAFRLWLHLPPLEHIAHRIQAAIAAAGRFRPQWMGEAAGSRWPNRAIPAFPLLAGSADS